MNFQGFTPIHWAAFMGNMDAVRLLAENGADATAMSKLWYTALSAPFLNQENSLDEGRVSKFVNLAQLDKNFFYTV